MLAISNVFDIQVIAEPVVIGQNPVWAVQPTPSFMAKVAGDYQLDAYDPDGGAITYSWAPDSANRPSWLTILGTALHANGTQQGDIVSNLKLRATDAEGKTADSQFFSVTSKGWTTIPSITFIEGDASSINIANYFVGYNPSSMSIQVAAGSLDGVSFEEPNLVYDGIGAAGTATFQFEDVSRIGGQAGLSVIVPINENPNPLTGGTWGVWKYGPNRRLDLGWRRGRPSLDVRLGDWLDKNQVEQGLTPWSTLTVSKSGLPKKVSLDVRDLVARWKSNGRNKGFFIFNRDNSVNQFGSRNHATALYHPLLTVKGSDGKIFTLPCTADAHLNKSTGSDISRYATIWCDDSQSLVLWFEVEKVTSPSISTATLDLWLLGGNSSTANLEVYELDGQEVTLFDGVGIPGIAENYLLDQGLENHPAVIDSFDFREDYVGLNSPNRKFFQGGIGQSDIRIYGFDSELNCNTLTLGLIANSDDIGVSDIEFPLFDSNDLPLADDLYARYLVRYNSPWSSLNSMIKMPGFSYRWGRRDNSTQPFSPTSGNSGQRPNGLISPSYTRWAAWVVGLDVAQNRLIMHDKLLTTGSTRRMPAEGEVIRPMHFVPFWASMGVTEGNVYYARNALSVGNAFSVQLSATPTGPILPVPTGNIDFAITIPALVLGDPSQWELFRHGGSMRSQTGLVDPDPANAYGRLLEMHSLMNYPGMGFIGQQEPLVQWEVNDIQSVFYPDRWYSIEHHCKMNTVTFPIRPDMFGGGVGNSDGLYEVYVDGQLAMRWENICWRNHPACGIQSFWFNVYHGGTYPSNKSFTEWTMTFARFAVSTQYIGPIRRS